MDNLNITMEEYRRLEEEKSRRRAIVFNKMLTSEAPLSYEPTISSRNDEIDFRISFDESDDEDYTTLELGLVYLFETAMISTMDLDGVTSLNCQNSCDFTTVTIIGESEELPKELSRIIMIEKMVKLHQDLKNN
nr:hypothetical protein [Tanacetum cinerariifolium]